MNGQKSLFVAVALFIVAVSGVYFYSKSGMNYSDNEQHVERHAGGVQILETVNLNSSVPEFRLHVQTPLDYSGTPRLLKLVSKKTGSVSKELSLTLSAFPNECISHHEMLDTVKKWDTEWFTVPEITSVNTIYEPKLNEYFDIQVSSGEGMAVKTSESSSIDGVCYQESEAKPMTPVPQYDDAPPED